MWKEVLDSKIHRATVTETEKDYIGSVTVGENMLEELSVSENDKVQVVNCDNGERLETYVIEGDKHEICLNGAAARKASVGDKVIIIKYTVVEEDKEVEPEIVHVDDENEVVERE